MSMKERKNNPLIFPPDSAPYGTSYAEWTASWWKWILSAPIHDNPVNYHAGVAAKIQRGPVWFLAGTTEGIANRECIIPANKSILYPVLNFGATLADEPTLKTEQELIALARREMDRISNLEIKVDGEKISDIQNYRIQSPVFDIVLPENNLFGGLAGPTRGVSEGYWLFLKGLPKGNHRIQSLGSCLAGQLTIGANYDIIVQ